MPESPDDSAHSQSTSDAIRWLHLSDLHLGCRGPEIWWQAHDELKVAIRDGVRRLGAPDLILFTGDLSFSGSKELFRLVDQFLDDLLGWIRDAGAAADPVVVPVPGNHDVCRQQGLDASRYLVLDQYDRGNDDEVGRALRKALWDDRDASFLDPLFAPYQAWLKRRILPQRKRPSVRIDASYFPGDLTVELDLPGRFPLLVVGLNSTWIQYKAGDFDGRLELPAAQFQAALGPAAKGSPLARLEGRRALLLMHQPESWLGVKARSDFRQMGTATSCMPDGRRRRAGRAGPGQRPRQGRRAGGQPSRSPGLPATPA